jgi:serine protease Do
MDFDAEEAYESIFVIYSGRYEGSGFAIGSNTVVSNAHVIDDRNSITVKTYSGDEFRASIYLINEALDIVILSVENAEFTPLEVGDSEQIRVGEEIYAIGAPRSLDYTLTKGVISNKSRTIGFNKYIQIDAAINSGNSGGPLLNNIGQVIGVNSMKISDAEGIALAIPISSVVSFMEGNDMELTEDKTVDGHIEYSPHNALSDEEDSEETVRKGKTSPLTIVLAILLGISFLLNVVLIVILVYRKNKDIIVPVDSRDRTDFEIDIME